MIRNILLCLFVISLLHSCKKETKAIIFKEVQKTTDTNELVEVYIPEATGNSEISNAINSEIRNWVANALEVGDSNTNAKPTLEAQIDAFNTSFNEFVKYFPESPQHWDAQINGELMFQSPKIISIAFTSYINTGGAHGNTVITFLNFDAETGQSIPTKNLFKDLEAATPVIKSHFNTTVKDKSTLFEPESFKLPENIGYTNEGLVFLYNTYEIAPYASGIIEFRVPFKALEHYLVFEHF